MDGKGRGSVAATDTAKLHRFPPPTHDAGISRTASGQQEESATFCAAFEVLRAGGYVFGESNDFIGFARCKERHGASDYGHGPHLDRIEVIGTAAANFHDVLHPDSRRGWIG